MGYFSNSSNFKFLKKHSEMKKEKLDGFNFCSLSSNLLTKNVDN